MNHPVTSESFSYTKSCSSFGISITYQNVPAGYRPFIDAYISPSDNNQYQLSYKMTILVLMIIGNMHLSL